MENLPKVSVIIPVYNVEQYLAACLDSVLSQTLNDIEVICVNDGSTDRSLEILREYEDKDKRIIVITQTNRGQGKARNVGIDIAKGDYISFVDSDDMIVPDCLEKLYECSENERLEIVSSEIDVIYEDESLREITSEDYYNKKGSYNHIYSGKILFANMIDNNDFCVSANILFIKREWLKSVGIVFPTDIYFEDNVFCLKCYAKAKRMKQIPFRGYIYRVRKFSTMTSQIDFKRVYSWLDVFREQLALLLDDKDDELFQTALVKYIKIYSSYIQTIFSKLEWLPDIDLPPIHNLIKFLLNLDKLDKDENKLLLLGFEKLVADSKGAIIYGAGEVGKYVVKYLYKVGLQRFVKFYTVSEIKKGAQYLDEVSILPLDSINKKDDALILLCSNDKHQSEMKQKLAELKISNYFALNGRLRKLIREAVNN